MFCLLQVASQFAILTSSAEVTSDILKGRYVQILDRSTFNEEEKQTLTDLVCELGGSVTFRIVLSRESDVCVVGSAPAKRFLGPLQLHKRRFGVEYDVLRHTWLLRCRDRGHFVDPSPADFVHLSDRTLNTLIASEGYDQCVSAMCRNFSFHHTRKPYYDVAADIFF